MAKTYELEFKGYKVEENWSSLPKESGIYCVYAATRSKRTQNLMKPRLLYIGEAEDLRKRVPQEPKDRRDKWKRKLTDDEVLCVSYAMIEPKSDRERAEAAMINWHQPPCNREYKDRFPFPQTTIVTTGKNVELDEEFVVYRDD